MRIKIRIYNPYDLDIIALTEAPNFSVANAMKQTLKYYAAGKRYLVEIPALTEKLDNDQYVKGFYVELDDNADAEAVAFIKSIPDGYRNAFMKNIFRASFEVCPLSLYMGDGGAAYVAKMIQNPRYGRHPVQRELMDPVHLAAGEVGVIISDEATDVSQLPQGKKKATPKPVRTKEETLRDLTQKAYGNAGKKEEEQRRRQHEAVAAIPKPVNKPAIDSKTASDLDDLLDSMM